MRCLTFYKSPQNHQLKDYDHWWLSWLKAKVFSGTSVPHCVCFLEFQGYDPSDHNDHVFFFLRLPVDWCFLCFFLNFSSTTLTISLFLSAWDLLSALGWLEGHCSQKKKTPFNCFSWWWLLWFLLLSKMFSQISLETSDRNLGWFPFQTDCDDIHLDLHGSTVILHHCWIQLLSQRLDPSTAHIFAYGFKSLS